MSNKIKYPVLVIDDEEDLRDLIQMTLVKMGLDVDTASGVIEAKEKLAKNIYSLILTDMRMPDGTGLEVVEFIENNNLDFPVAVITAYGNADNAVEALKRGAFDYLQKPITLAQLRTLVKSAIKIDSLDNSSSGAKSTKPVTPPPKVTSTEKKSSKKIMDDDDLGFLSKRNDATSADQIDFPPIDLDDDKDNLIREKLLLNEKKTEPNLQKDKKITKEAVEKPEDSAQILFPRLAGDSASMQEVKEIIVKLSRTLVPVYISGESGTGKEQAARSIHELSDRKDEPFVPVNCGAIPENLMESEFFGHKKGSFTGADTETEGFFQYANKGTIFLDEVADLPLAMQVKLLRVIQEKMVRKIGDNKEISIDVRILCATHKNLEKEVEEGRFRQDLYYRLNVITLRMPPLRDLKDDLPKLIRWLLLKYTSSSSSPIKLSSDAFKMLLHYDYPGNFRELENILERAVALSSNNSIKEEDLQLRAVMQIHSHDGTKDFENNLENNHDELEALMRGQVTLQDILDAYEKNILIKALERSKHNRTQAAKLLGISFRSIRYRLERLAIE